MRARPDWHIAYAYDRWRPTFFAAYSDDTDGWREGEVRTREVETVAVCFINAHANPANERRMCEILEEEIPGARLSCWPCDHDI